MTDEGMSLTPGPEPSPDDERRAEQPPPVASAAAAELGEEAEPGADGQPPAQPPWPPTGKYTVVQPMPPPRPPNPVFPYLSMPKGRRRRNDWRVLVIGLVVVAALLVGCCLGGYALYFHFAGAPNR